MRWISLFRQVPKVRPDGQVPKEIQESGGPRGKKGEPGLRGRKAFKGGRCTRGRWGPTGPRGEKGEPGAGASGRSWSHGSARHPRRGRLTRGDGPDRPPGEKRESLVCRGFRENPVPRVRKASKERPAYRERWVRPAPGGEKGEPGAQGLQGEIGPTGPQGIQGEVGLQGGDGPDRPPGRKKESLVCRGFRENPVPRVRKASKERPAYKGEMGPTGPRGEKGESLVHRGPGRNWSHGSARYPRRGRLTRGRWARPAPGEKGEPGAGAPGRNWSHGSARHPRRGRLIKERWARPAPGGEKGEPGVQGL